MSTPGKVLLVIVMLATAGAVLLTAMVAQLNANYAQQLAQREQSLADLEAEIPQIRDQIREVELSFDRLKDQRNLQLRQIKTQIVRVENDIAIADQRINAETIKRDDLLANVQRSEQMRDQYLDDRRQAEQTKAELTAEVRRLIADTNQQLDRLAQLREEFTRLADANQKRLEELKQRSRTYRQSYLGEAVATPEAGLPIR